MSGAYADWRTNLGDRQWIHDGWVDLKLLNNEQYLGKRRAHRLRGLYAICCSSALLLCSPYFISHPWIKRLMFANKKKKKL